MNYRFEFDGIDVDCDSLPDGIELIDFSYGTNIDLDEHALDEGKGVCSALDHPIDWNLDGVIASSIVMNINAHEDEPASCGSVLTVLSDHDDWASLDLPAVVTETGGEPPPIPAQSCRAPPQHSEHP